MLHLLFETVDFRPPVATESSLSPYVYECGDPLSTPGPVPDSRGAAQLFRISLEIPS